MPIQLTPNQRYWISHYASGLWLLPVCAYFVIVPYGTQGWLGVPWLLVHSFNLIIHEAGHFFFRFFGELMMFAGGSLIQVLFPLAFLSTAIRTDSKWGAQLSLLWLGQNFIDVSVYAADAVLRQLPLIGGLGVEAHDWYNILWRLDLLEHTPLIAGLIYFCAFPVWALMLAAPRWVG